MVDLHVDPSIFILGFGIISQAKLGVLSPGQSTIEGELRMGREGERRRRKGKWRAGERGKKK